MKSNYIPNEDRVVVKELKGEKQTAGGIIIPVGVSNDKMVEVEVVAVGDGYRYNGQVIPMNVVPEQKIIIGVHSGTSYEMDGEKFRIIRQEDILYFIGDDNPTN
jgi:chaperonin GroES